MATEFLSFRHSLTCLRLVETIQLFFKCLTHHITKYVDKHYKQFEEVF